MKVTEELFDEELQGMVRFTDATQQDAPKTEKKKTVEKNVRLEKAMQKPKDEAVNAKWEPVFEFPKKDPDLIDKLKACAKCAFVCGGLNMLLLYWQQTGQMASSAAVPSMCVCMLICGIGIGRNWWR